MDFALAQLAMIFLPGILWANINRKYGKDLKRENMDFIIQAFLFGLLTYLALSTIYKCLGWDFSYAVFIGNPEEIALPYLWDEILYSIPTSFILSIFWLKIVHYDLVAKFMRYIKATKRLEDIDIWSSIFSNDNTVEWIRMYDLENGYIFEGQVERYSESEEQRELLLENASVYDEHAKKIYDEGQRYYIARSKDKIWIEFIKR